jgi:hypothetical protein
MLLGTAGGPRSVALTTNDFSSHGHGHFCLSFDSVATFRRAPFTRLAFSSPANGTEQLAALVTRVRNPDATLLKKLLALLAGELHQAHL